MPTATSPILAENSTSQDPLYRYSEWACTDADLYAITEELEGVVLTAEEAAVFSEVMSAPVPATNYHRVPERNA